MAEGWFEQGVAFRDFLSLGLASRAEAEAQAKALE